MIIAVGTPVHLKEVARVPIEKPGDLMDGALVQHNINFKYADIVSLVMHSNAKLFI